MTSLIDHAKFIALLIAELPEAAAVFDEYSDGLLHCEMATVARCTAAAAGAGDWPTVRRHLAFVERVHRDAAPDVDNAVYVSYMECLPVWGEPDDPSELRAMLPTGLAGVLRAMEGRAFE